MRNIPSAVARIDWIIGNLDNPDASIRREAAAGAQYAVLGHLPSEKAALLLQKLATRLEAKVNGHVMLNEPCEYVRERCANAFELASSSGKAISAFLPVLRWSSEYDPHEWVRGMAADAIRYHENRHHDSLPLPEKFTTRPQSYIREIKPAEPLKRQLRA
ncbi:MAG: hypothetical protein U0R44_03915 [Candidatus Micrarchaeia archaeon]